MARRIDQQCLTIYVTGRTIFVDGGMTDYPDFAHGG
jgi:hypothetical protein